MIISHTKKFVILSPWKTGSSTMNVRFKSINESPYSRFYYFSRHLNRVVHQHLTCAEFAALPEAQLRYPVASFVRNPYDRVYSGFIQVQRDIGNQADAPYPANWIREHVVKQLEENRIQLEKAEYDLNQWVAGLTEAQIFEVGRNTSFPLHPAHYWTHLAGSQFVSFIGRIESFEEDISLLCDQLQISSPERLNDNTSDGSMATEFSADGYRHVKRMNRASLDKIFQLFREDFDLFGYAKQC